MNSVWRIGLRAAGTGLLVFLVLLIAVAVVVGHQPKVYRSTARLQVETPVNHDRVRINGGDWAAFDPFGRQSTAETIQSMHLVEEVVREFELARRWGLDGEAGGHDIARAQVRRNLAVRPIRNTALVEVMYHDRDPEVAAEIANGVLEIYQRLSAAAGVGRADMASARIIDLATPGHFPVRPNVPMWFFLGAIGSGGVAVLATVGVLVRGFVRRSPSSAAG